MDLIGSICTWCWHRTLFSDGYSNNVAPYWTNSSIDLPLSMTSHGELGGSKNFLFRILFRIEKSSLQTIKDAHAVWLRFDDFPEIIECKGTTVDCSLSFCLSACVTVTCKSLASSATQTPRASRLARKVKPQQWAKIVTLGYTSNPKIIIASEEHYEYMANSSVFDRD